MAAHVSRYHRHHMSRYQMLVIDLDGTLLNSAGEVSILNALAIRRAHEAGLHVVIATGRSLAESRAALAAIEHDGFVVTAGGAMLCHAASGGTISRRTMPLDIVRAITQCLIAHGHPALILKDAHLTGYDYLIVGDAPLDRASQWWFSAMQTTSQQVATIDDDPHPEDSVRAAAVSCRSRLEPVATRLRSDLGDRCCLQHWSAVTQFEATGSATHLLEAFQSQVNKWTMVLDLCRQLSIEPERVASIGDGLNDLELIRSSGLGIAMANSSPEIMHAASRVAGHHNEHGVAGAIDNIISGVW
jgi:5-amino-6-(5-phospho-D-ribitylamino)uracil phosphatase